MKRYDGEISEGRSRLNQEDRFDEALPFALKALELGEKELGQHHPEQVAYLFSWVAGLYSPRSI